jgi:membrane associated rhomboid family serine protease
MSATTAIIIINLLVFIAMVATDWQSLLMFSPAALLDFGGSSGVETIARLQLWRLLTSAFVHGGAIHLGINLWVLSKLGPEVEGQFGASRFVAIYVVAAIIGALGSVTFHPLTIDAGASAAIFGIFGALIAIVWRRPERFPKGYLSIQAKVLAGLIVYSAVFALIDKTMDHAAHASGLLAGLVAGLALLPEGRLPVLRASALTMTVCGLCLLAIALLPKNGAMYFARAAVLHHEGKDKEAVLILTQAIECNPKVAVAYNNRAWSELAVADYKAALEDANKSISLDQKLATTYDTRAMAYLMLGQRQNAIADLDKAIHLDSGDAAFYYHRAVAKQVQNDPSFVADAAEATKLRYNPDNWEPKLAQDTAPFSK